MCTFVHQRRVRLGPCLLLFRVKELRARNDLGFDFDDALRFQVARFHCDFKSLQLRFCVATRATVYRSLRARNRKKKSQKKVGGSAKNPRKYSKN